MFRIPVPRAALLLLVLLGGGAVVPASRGETLVVYAARDEQLIKGRRQASAGLAILRRKLPRGAELR